MSGVCAKDSQLLCSEARVPSSSEWCQDVTQGHVEGQDGHSIIWSRSQRHIGLSLLREQWLSASWIRWGARMLSLHEPRTTLRGAPHSKWSLGMRQDLGMPSDVAPQARRAVDALSVA